MTRTRAPSESASGDACSSPAASSTEFRSSRGSIVKRIAGLITLSTVLTAALAFATDSVVFRKVDYYEDEGEKEKKHDARLALDPNARTILIADEKHGADKKVYALIPYDKVKKIVYERSAHRRYKAGLLVTPWLLFSKGKKHWAHHRV